MSRWLLRVAAPLDLVLHWLDRLFVLLAGLALAVSLTINIVNLAARNLFSLALPWVFSWTMVLFVWMVFFAFFPIYRRRIDIAVDVVVRRLPAAVRLVFRLLTDALGIAVVGVILMEGPRIIGSQVGAIEFVGIQRYCLSIPLLASCALIALDFLADALHALAGQEPPHVEALDVLPLHG